MLLPVRRWASRALFVALLLILGGCLLTSCAHKYHAPDPARVIAATKRVESTAAAAHASHQLEREKIKEAQAAADSITVASATLLEKVDSLAKLLPPEFQPPLAAIRVDVTDLQAKETVLTTDLVQGWQKSDETEKHLVATDQNVAELKTEQATYFSAAKAVADKATADSAADNKKLWWYRTHFWLSWIAFITGLIALGFLVFLWWTGRMALSSAKLASKLAV